MRECASLRSRENTESGCEKMRNRESGSERKADPGNGNMG